jgi:diguanylate cyclase (GGDEF)-like protein/PAS domain S-box-containing protein
LRVGVRDRPRSAAVHPNAMGHDISPQSVTSPPPGGGSALARLRLPRSLRGRGLARLRASIGLRLALLALALGLPFLLYVVGNAARHAEIERDEAKLQALSLARLAAARVDDYVGDMVSALALVTYGVSPTVGATERNEAFLHSVRHELPRSVHNVGIWMLDGRNAGTLNGYEPGAKASIADRDVFRRALATGTMAVEGPVVSPWNDGHVALFARPLRDQAGAPTGVVTISVDLHDLLWLLDLRGAAPAETVVSLVNADGFVLARNVDPDRWIGTSVLNVGKAREHLERGEGVDETLGADRVPRISGYTRSARLAWHVFVGVPQDTALSAARTNVVEALLLGTLSLLVGALFAARVGARIATPLRRLAYDATLLARGNLAHRTTVAGDDETGVLANTLNRLAQTVEERTKALHEKTQALEEKTQALEHRTQELATITANVPVLIAYLDADLRLGFVNEYFRDVFHIEPAKVLGRPLCEITGKKVFARIEGRLREVRAGMPQTFETTFTADGSGMVFLVACFPDYGEGQEVRGAYVVCQDITRRKHAEEALAGRERFIRLIADGIPARITYIDRQGRLLFGNRRFTEFWGHAPNDIVGRRLVELVSADAYATIAPELERSYAGEPRRFDLVAVRHGKTRHFQVDHVPDVDAGGHVQGVFTISQDVTDLREAQAIIEDNEQRLLRITDSIPSMVGYIDVERRYRFNSRYYETWLGKPLAEIAGKSVRDVLGEATYASIVENLDRAFAGERVDFEVEVDHAGKRRWLRGSYIPDVDASGRVAGVYTSSTDVTPQKEVERQLARLAQKDTLTGLPNRHAFNDGVVAALARSQRAGTQIALMFLDVDAFKTINDTYGHAGGDEVLREFGRRLQAAVRPTDLVARLAGDEFVVVLEGIHTREECRFVARRVIASVRPPFRIGDAMLKVTTSIGIAIGHGSTSAEALLKRADSALYAAKGQGRDTFEIAI